MTIKRIAAVGAALAIGAAAIFWNVNSEILAQRAEIDDLSEASQYRSLIDSDDLGWLVPGQTEEGWQPRRDLPAWPIPTPMDWDADPFNDRNWRAHLEGWRIMDSVLQSAYVHGDASDLPSLVPLFMAWPDFYESLEPDRQRYADSNAGNRAMRLALLIDAYRSGDLPLGDAERETLFDLAQTEVEHLSTPGKMVLGNHGLFEVSGLDRLCEVAHDEPFCAEGRRIASEHFDRLVDSQFDEHGVHREHSPSYHFFAKRVIRGFGLTDRFASGRGVERVVKAETVGGWLVFPDDRISRIGDSDGNETPLSDASGHIHCLDEDSCYAVAPTWRSGYGIVRSLPEDAAENSSMLFLMGMYHNGAHKHADDLSFELFEFGRPLIVDTGKYGYQRDEMRDYVVTDVAHNTVGIEGRQYIPRDLPPYGNALEEPRIVDGAFVLSGRIERPDDFANERELIYRPGRWLIVHDRLEAEEELAYASRLHFHDELEVEIAGRILTADFDEGTTMQVELVDDDCELSTFHGSEEPMRGWHSVGYLEMVPTTMAEAVCPGQVRTISWVVSFDRAARQEALSRIEELN